MLEGKPYLLLLAFAVGVPLLSDALSAETPAAPRPDPVPKEDAKKFEAIAQWSQANAAYQAGLAAFAKSQGDEAVAKFTTALKAVAGFTDARFARGRTYYEMKRYAPAEEDFTRVIAEKPAVADAYYYRGLARWNLNRTAEALADFDGAVGKEPRNFAFHEKRAILRQQLKQYAAAREDLDVMVALQPLSPAVLEQRAKVHALMGEKPLAEQDERWADQLREAGF